VGLIFHRRKKELNPNVDLIQRIYHFIIHINNKIETISIRAANGIHKILIFISFLVIQGFSDRRVAENRGAFPGEFLCESGCPCAKSHVFQGRKNVGGINSEPIVFRGIRSRLVLITKIKIKMRFRAFFVHNSYFNTYLVHILLYIHHFHQTLIFNSVALT
jgi:hypothetical protein